LGTREEDERKHKKDTQTKQHNKPKQQKLPDLVASYDTQCAMTVNKRKWSPLPN